MTAPTFRPATVRQRLTGPVEGSTHLAACSVAPRTRDMDDAVATMLDDLSRPGFWEACEQQMITARRLFAGLVGADVDQVAILPNAGVAAHQAVAGRRWRRRRDLLTTTAEFPGIAHVWQAQSGATVRWCGTTAGRVHEGDYLRSLTTHTGFVSVPAVTYRDGARLDVRRIVDAAHAVGAVVFVDAYQAAGVMPLRVDALRCDYLVAGTGKYLLGLPGLAFLYVRDPDGPAPTLTGWLGRTDPHAFRTVGLDTPAQARRYETGTPAVAALYTAAAGLARIQTLDLTQVRRHTQRLVATAAMRLAGQGETVRVHPSDAQGAHLAVVDPYAEDIARWLAGRTIVTAPRGEVLRLATHAYTTDDDIDAACEAIASYRHHTGTRGGHR
ncbi:aminotransferase class V-fold PLP-dependent enzyme [Micromonospora sp. SH-82]|uniref:aminotransferase class V-fold PLP-dependent enzyme n=1 Tax=Micromonospora sp. SH-82 TaxID=3132938 RepID=UPI003EBB86E0